MNITVHLCFQIVRHDRTMERIVFPIPEICEFLTEETKNSVLKTTERDEQGSKVADFFSRHDDMFSEMKWQKKLRGHSALNDCSFSLLILFIKFVNFKWMSLLLILT